MINDNNDNNQDNIGVFWDVDGTLADSYRLGYSSTNAVLSRHGKGPISEEEYHLGTKYTTPRRLAWHTTGDPDHPSGEALGRDFDDLYVSLVSSETAPLYAGILHTLRHLQREFPSVRFGALSNACTAYVKAVLDANSLSSCFPVALGADNVSAAKPAPQGLLQCCSSLNIAPQRCIYVGDSPTDGQAAKAAGMRGVGVTWGSHSVESVEPHFDVTVHTVDDLLVALTRICREIIANEAQTDLIDENKV